MRLYFRPMRGSKSNCEGGCKTRDAEGYPISPKGEVYLARALTFNRQKHLDVKIVIRCSEHIRPGSWIEGRDPEIARLVDPEDERIAAFIARKYTRVDRGAASVHTP